MLFISGVGTKGSEPVYESNSNSPIGNLSDPPTLFRYIRHYFYYICVGRSRAAALAGSWGSAPSINADRRRRAVDRGEPC